MFIYSLRLSTIKFFSVIILSISVLFCLVAFVPVESTEAGSDHISYSGILSEEDRVAFIKQFGWEVEAITEDKVTIPSEFDSVYSSYNDLQKEQGLSLSHYKGKEVSRYTYRITNYPDYEGEVNLTILVYKNKVVAGDVCSTAENGFQYGLSGSQSPDQPSV